MALCFLLSWSSKAAEIKEHIISDDGWVEIPLDFTFPFYGNSYVTSFMFANGVVGFLDPLDVPGQGYIYDGLCCNGPDLTSFTGVRFNYTIMPWSTDLIDNGLGQFFTQGDSTYQKYMWKNLAEYNDVNTKNTFDLTIFPLGNIDVNYETIHIKNHGITAGIVGDLSAGEYEQWFYNAPNPTSAVYWDSQQSEPIEIGVGESICSVVPLSSILCHYYPTAYAEDLYAQQCRINSLYDTGCPNYWETYTNQQCSIDALWSNTCPNYEIAYLDNQCLLDPSYSMYCPDYYTTVDDEEEEWEDYQDIIYEDEIFIPDTIVINSDYEFEFVFEPEIEIEMIDLQEFEVYEDYTMDTFDLAEMPEIEMIAEIEAEMQEFFEDFSTSEPPPMDDFILEEFEESFDMPEEILMEEIPEEMLEPEMEETVMEEPIDEPIEETDSLSEEQTEEESQPEEIDDELHEGREEESEDDNEETEVEDSIEEETEEEVEADDVEDESGEEEESEEPTDEELDESTEEAEEPETKTKEIMVAKVEVKEPTKKEKMTAKEKKMRELITNKLKSLAIEVGEASTLQAQKDLQSFIIALLNYNSGFNVGVGLVDGSFYDSKDIYSDMKIPENQRGLRNGLANQILHNKLVDLQWQN